MYAVEAYALGWMIVLMMIVLHAQSYTTRRFFHPALRSLDRRWLVDLTRTQTSTSRSSELRLPYGVLLVSTNLAFLLVRPQSSFREAVFVRSGQLAIVNLLLLLLLSSRHSILLKWIYRCQPEMMWVHWLLAFVINTEVVIHATLWIHRSLTSSDHGESYTRNYLAISLIGKSSFQGLVLLYGI